MNAVAEEVLTGPDPVVESGPEDSAALFDRSKYDQPELRIDKIDGKAIDRPRLKFAGGLVLDRMSPEDVALFNSLPVDAELELRVLVTVSGVGMRRVVGKDGDLIGTVGERTLNVDAAWLT